MIRNIINNAIGSGKKSLNEYQASMVMREIGVSMVRSHVCKNLDEVMIASEGFEYPLVLKILSSDILHKTDAGCVEIGIKDKCNLAEAYKRVIKNASNYNQDAKIDGVLLQEMVSPGLELIIGMKKDSQFGPVILFGLGGIYVEIFHDISLRLLPINRNEAIEMIEETNVYNIIKGARGKEFDMEEVVSALLRISKLVEENKEIEEIDLNPFFLYEKGKGSRAVDALISLSF